MIGCAFRDGWPKRVFRLGLPRRGQSSRLALSCVRPSPLLHDNETVSLSLLPDSWLGWGQNWVSRPPPTFRHHAPWASFHSHRHFPSSFIHSAASASSSTIERPLPKVPGEEKLYNILLYNRKHGVCNSLHLDGLPGPLET